MKNTVKMAIAGLILLFSHFAFTQKVGNGGIICNDDIKSSLKQLAAETPTTSSFEMQGHISLGPIYESIARGEIKNSTDVNSKPFELSVKRIEDGQSVYVLTYNSSVCGYKSLQTMNGSNALKEMLRNFVNNSLLKPNGGNKHP